MSSHQAVVYYSPGDVRLEQYAIPSAEPGGLLVRVEACAICGSDLKMSRIGNPKVVPPRVIGHEFCGVVEAVGEGAEGFSVGDRVTMATTVGCGECIYCRKGAFNICKDTRAMGFYYDGAMAEYVAIPRQAVALGNVVKVESLKAELAALAEPMSCAVNSVSKVPLDEIRNVVILGIGALGLFHALVLKEAGVQNIIGVGSVGRKKEIADELGLVTKTLEEFDREYLELSEGNGFDLVVITMPSNEVQCDAPKYARKQGYVSYFASLPVAEEQITISSRLLHYGELFYYGTSDSTAVHIRRALEILERQQENVERIITTMPLDQFQAGMDGVANREYAKVVLKP